MSKADDGQISRLTRLGAMTDEPDTTDLPELDAGAWAHAEVGRFFRPRKEALTIHLDAEIVAWFRQLAGSHAYETAINAALWDHVSKNSR